MSERVCVGAIAGAFGVKGDVRLKSFCAEPTAIGDYGPLFTEDGKQSFSVKLGQPIPNGFSARLGGVGTREAAEALRGIRLYADRDKLPSLPDDEFYHADLIGLTMMDTGGNVIGKVTAVLNHGAGDILEVQRAGKGSALVPFTLAVVPTVDVAGGRIIADPPEGLLE
ncbi:ribosome maturation factor RimM [Pararhodobacter sp. CCB-MM2]|uniref:ribosome maturation factor RimM n=1 Tax=Pararhodobacter sp. CCB-MM2 TaxID=1786003 RepID=UPI00082C3F61|nr:ribosome maturation factor RimM [Pararhodobacter sp. CCB-MM2]MCA2013190.1 ribosome maturation factor RimM [Cereibacter sphaeroides]